MAESTAFSWRPLLFGAIGALLAAAFTTAGNFIYHYLTTPAPGLAYSISEGPGLPTPGGLKQICVVNARNAGSKEVSDLVVEINLKDGKIEQGSWRASEGVTGQDELSNNSYQVRIPLLNPGEHVSLATIMTAPGSEAAPSVVVRGVGIRGVRETTPLSPENKRDTLLSVVLTALVALVSLTTLAEFLRMRSLRLRARHSALNVNQSSVLDVIGMGRYSDIPDAPDQRETLTYILYACGADEEAEKTRLLRPNQVTYREFADHLLAHGLRIPPSERTQEIMALQCMLLIPTMADASRENVKRALRILCTITDEQMQKIAERCNSNWRDEVDRLVAESSSRPVRLVAPSD